MAASDGAARIAYAIFQSIIYAVREDCDSLGILRYVPI